MGNGFKHEMVKWFFELRNFFLGLFSKDEERLFVVELTAEQIDDLKHALKYNQGLEFPKFKRLYDMFNKIVKDKDGN